jgi:hypothetical protein
MNSINTDITLKNMTIDWDSADRITVLTLTEYRQRLQNHLDQVDGQYLHPNDEVHNRAMIQAIDFVLKDFGNGY